MRNHVSTEKTSLGTENGGDLLAPHKAVMKKQRVARKGGGRVKTGGTRGQGRRESLHLMQIHGEWWFNV